MASTHGCVSAIISPGTACPRGQPQSEATSELTVSDIVGLTSDLDGRTRNRGRSSLEGHQRECSRTRGRAPTAQCGTAIVGPLSSRSQQARHPCTHRLTTHDSARGGPAGAGRFARRAAPARDANAKLAIKREDASIKKSSQKPYHKWDGMRRG